MTPSSTCAILLLAAMSACGTSEGASSRLAETTNAPSTSPAIPATTDRPTPVLTDPPEPSTAPVDLAGGIDGPVMYSPGPYSGGDEARVGGTLTRDGNCLYFGTETDPSRRAMIWPFATTWDPVTQEVVGPEGTRIGIGDRVVASGGYGDPRRGPLIGDELFERMVMCASAAPGQMASVQFSISIDNERCNTAVEAPVGEDLAAEGYVVTELESTSDRRIGFSIALASPTGEPGSSESALTLECFVDGTWYSSHELIISNEDAPAGSRPVEPIMNTAGEGRFLLDDGWVTLPDEVTRSSELRLRIPVYSTDDSPGGYVYVPVS